MNIFLDTSSLVKLYHQEDGTEYLDSLFEDFDITEIFLSQLTIIEYSSAIMKKVRTQELSKEESNYLIKAFESDFENYSFVDISSDLVISSKKLISKYGEKGLRTLDSIQLASIIQVKNEIEFAISADELLKKICIQEGIEVK